MSRRPRPWLAPLALAVLLGAVHAAVAPDRAGDRVRRLIDAGGMARARVSEGEWWRLVTAVFLHADARHLLGNLAGIALLGTALASQAGPARMAVAFAGAGAAGNLLDYALGRGVVTVGASGGVFGLLGALIALTVRRARADPRALWKREALRIAGLALLALLATGTPGRTAWFAHLGGFGAGLALAPWPRRARLRAVPAEKSPGGALGPAGTARGPAGGARAEDGGTSDRAGGADDRLRWN